MNESKESIEKVNDAINFNTASSDAKDIHKTLTGMLYDFNLASEQKQVEKLIVDYLTTMNNVDSTNGNTDTCNRCSE